MPGSTSATRSSRAIGGRLFLYALTNEGFYAIPSGTVLATSDDGARLVRVRAGRPARLAVLADARASEPSARPAAGRSGTRPPTGRTTASRSCCARRTAARSSASATIHRGDANDETEIAFLPRADGSLSARLVATCRLEVTPDNLVGHPDAGDAPRLRRSSLHRVESTSARSARRLTRLDGPVAFADGGRLFFVARAQPGPRHWPFAPRERLRAASAPRSGGSTRAARRRTGRAPARRGSSGSPTSRARATPRTPASRSRAARSSPTTTRAASTATTRGSSA